MERYCLAARRTQTNVGGSVAGGRVSVRVITAETNLGGNHNIFQRDGAWLFLPKRETRLFAPDRLVLIPLSSIPSGVVECCVVPNMSEPPQTAMASNLSLFNIGLGFDLLIDPSDYITVLLVRDGLFEVPETELVTRILRPKDTCIDAGSQVGYYSCLFVKLVGDKGRVSAFDANPQACPSTRRNLALNGSYSAEVIHAALADHGGTVPFHISTSDQTGLSSLAPIPTCEETILVPRLRLETFLNERRVNSVRLLKIDVEGAEEMVLRGLGHFLDDHTIDYILLECFDERLRLLNTSTEAVAAILKSAGYTSWEYRTQNGCGWSQADEVRSRGDCNYLFTSPEVSNDVPGFSLAPALN